jgi:malate dehydrogenase (oxaloacetate-decarboxylating)(NADP+)
LRLTKGELKNQNILFMGAGEAGIGIGDLIVAAMVAEGADAADARKRCSFVDSKGLVVRSRTDLAVHKLPYAHDVAFCPDLLTAIKTIKPTALIGVSGTPKAFPKEIVEEMCKINERPIIFALSNPTSKAECSAEEVYNWSDGKAIFASGSPFPAVTYKGQTFVPGQGNNAYIFPGVGLGVVAVASKRVTEEMFFVAAKTLALIVDQSDLDKGRIFPPLTKMREVSLAIAVAVAEVAYNRKLARVPRPKNLTALIKSTMFNPKYQSYV